MRETVKKELSAQDFADPTENYLGFADFALHGVESKVFKIASLEVDAVPVPMTGRKEQKVVATLVDPKTGKPTQKALIISKGKRKVLIALFGAVQNWIGKEIKLTADPEIKFKGEKVGGLVLSKP